MQVSITIAIFSSRDGVPLKKKKKVAGSACNTNDIFLMRTVIHRQTYFTCIFHVSTFSSHKIFKKCVHGCLLMWRQLFYFLFPMRLWQWRLQWRLLQSGAATSIHTKVTAPLLFHHQFQRQHSRKTNSFTVFLCKQFLVCGSLGNSWKSLQDCISSVENCYFKNTKQFYCF